MDHTSGIGGFGRRSASAAHHRVDGAGERGEQKEDPDRGHFDGEHQARDPQHDERQAAGAPDAGVAHSLGYRILAGRPHRFHSADPLAGAGLAQVLLGKARLHVLVNSSTNRFECPDCVGDVACATCGEPTRPAVLDHLQRALRRRLAS